jgi:hypothetical protein
VARIESMIEVNSYSTQVAQLQFEYVWIRQNMFRWTRYGSRWCLDDIWYLGMIIGFTNIERNITKKK